MLGNSETNLFLGGLSGSVPSWKDWDGLAMYSEAMIGSRNPFLRKQFALKTVCSKNGCMSETSILCFTGFQEKAIFQTKKSFGSSEIHNFPQEEIIAKWPHRLTEYFMHLIA